MEIKSLLIVNRGEIAVRIMRTAKAMGIKSFAILTSKEPNAVYVREATNVIDFQESLDDIPEFLDVDRIIKAAKENNIDAVHPGYGFLAENSYFAQRCEAEKIIFIGPSPDAIYKMGNKTIARKIAKKHKIPLLEGSKNNVKDVNEAICLAEKIGYPVIIKAAAGGGGKGMRIVRKESEMQRMFRMATSEARESFDDDAVFIEKYVENPRHIEFQIIGDKEGNVISLGERECSIQRKHQKLIEEAPSPALDDKLRAEMQEVAVRIAKAVNYYSAGTVEFLLDDHNNFYFMEMNTRIQVEHPVTEIVTGLDIVELMIRIAQGEKLPLKQEEVKLEGWAIEFRINAEDVQAGFSPNIGVIEKMDFPNSKFLRVDTGFEEGSIIPPNYDSMIAKFIAFGETRQKTISNAITTIKKVRIKGVKTTIPFCLAVLNNEDFQNGNFSTSFISDQMEKLYHQEEDEELMAALLALSDYLNDLYEEETNMELNGQGLSPWLLNKRIRSH